ncbi:MAG: hypothetical protein KY475_00680 [Planctomycetes bacterium]|nr:hypothetical protein [Planctomycetota bacterium]
MTSWVLNDETSKTAIGEVLALAMGSGLEIHDDSGQVVARIVVHPEAQHADDDALVQQAEADIDELRRRRSADRSDDVTTQQLLANAARRERK